MLVGELSTCRAWDCRVGCLVGASGTVDAPSLPDTINLGDVENRVKVIVLFSVVAARRTLPASAYRNAGSKKGKRLLAAVVMLG